MKSATTTLFEQGIDIMKMDDDFNTNLLHSHERYAEEYYKNKVGVLAEGVHPDEINPRAETWLKERGNWEAEVNQLRKYISEQDLIIHGITEGSENWKAEYDNCRALLQELVDLKVMKENLYKGNPDGKEYAERKPKAWEAAKAFLSTYQHECW